MAREAHPIRNNVIATLIAAAILAGLAQIGPVRPFLDRFLFSPLLAVWRWLVHSVPVPVWLLVALAVLALATVIRIVVAQLKSRSPHWLDYRADRFLGVHWRWTFSAGEVSRITPFCPIDDTLLVGDNGYKSFNLRCETCAQTWGPFEGDGHSLTGTIRRQIERKIRSGEWQSVVSPTAQERS